MGDAFDSSSSFIWLEELVWKAFFGYLECGATMFDVVSAEGLQLSYI